MYNYFNREDLADDLFHFGFAFFYFFHNNVISYCNRPYSSVEEMNESLVNNWNSVVGPEDDVYILGDFSLAVRPVELFVPRLNGKNIYLIPGNHDFVFPKHPKSKRAENYKKWYKHYEDCGLSILPCNYSMSLGKLGRVNLSHFPYKQDVTDERYQGSRLEDDGKILLCGHIHEKWKSKRTTNGTLMINVGTDAWNWHPVCQDSIIEHIREMK